jgi:hypothetical protein
MTYFQLRSLILFGVLAAVAQSVHGDQPPDVVSSDSAGNTAMGTGALYTNTTGYKNTAAGSLALHANTTGTQNAAVGTDSLKSNTTGVGNTALGDESMVLNSTGDYSTAVGYGSLSNSTGGNNTAVGNAAMYSNTAGVFNTAMGSVALFNNTTGGSNTGIGDSVLSGNTTGSFNSALGAGALLGNTTGANNSAIGYRALYWNTNGKGNDAQGVNALYGNTTGIRNLGIGSNALYENATGSYNIALGFDAGYNATGSDNIYISNQGFAESQTLRIGTQGSAGVVGSGILRAYIAGVANSQVTGSAVYVTSAGQLGVLASSERFKTDVNAMGSVSERLGELRPVTFKLKTDSKCTVQYGLIAEEVAKVYPELVVHGADGRIDGVRYEELAPLLLNEFKRDQATIARQAAEIRQLEQQTGNQLTAQAAKVSAQAEEIRDLQELVAGMQAGLLELKTQQALVAER